MSDMRLELVDVGSLEFDGSNARTHSEKNIRAIADSLGKFGQRRPLVVYGNTVIAGNGTLQAVKSLGWKQVAITRVPDEWTADEARAYAITDNRTAELADWDGEVLLDTLQALDPELLSATGFNESDIDDLEKLWGGPPDLDDLADELGTDDDEGWVTLKLRLPILVHEKWVAAVRATGLQDENEAINLLVQAAFDALTDGYDA
jgi:ParB-like chromosome segregation protein Spo0J